MISIDNQIIIKKSHFPNQTYRKFLPLEHHGQNPQQIHHHRIPFENDYVDIRFFIPPIPVLLNLTLIEYEPVDAV